MHIKSLLVFLLYIIGVLVGLTLIGIMTWGDYEASSYGFARRASEGLTGLSCPILLTRNETGVISLRISNPLDRPMHPSVRAELSAEFDPPVFIESMTLAPGESKRVEWAVGPENIDLENFIFASVQVYGFAPIPSRETTCGILIIDLPGRGINILIILGVFSIAALGLGLFWMNRYKFYKERSENLWYAILFLTALIAGGFVPSFMGAWLVAIAFMVIAFLVCLLVIRSIFLDNR